MKKNFTRFCSPRLGKRIPALCALALAVAGGMQAQEEAQSPWVGEQLPAESGEYYLYNKAGGGFLLGANSWGTQASLGEPGLLCTIAVDNGKYTIETVKGKLWLNHEGYIDKTAEGFTFADTEEADGLYEYTIYLDGTGYLKWGDGTVVNYGETADATNGPWLLVSKDQRAGTLDAATEENGVDATFYIDGANFGQKQSDAWQYTFSGGNFNFLVPQSGASTGNLITEMYNVTQFDLYQTITGVKNGRYVLSCQGFYRPGGNVNANGAQNALLYANTSSAPLQLLADDGSGVPNDQKTAASAFDAGRYAGNEVAVTVVDGILRIGVKKDVRIDRDWVAVDNFRLTYLGMPDASELVEPTLETLQAKISDFTGIGATAIAADLQAVYDKYAGGVSDADAAFEEMSQALGSANLAFDPAEELSGVIAEAEEFAGQAHAVVQPALNAAKEAAVKALAETKADNMAEVAPQQVEALNAAILTAKNWMGMVYPLQKAQELADEIGGLSGEEAYTKVVADLANAELTYEEMRADVTALNLVCRNAMTADFLSQASAENPIDLTSFITNPNIYNDGEKTEMPDGWIMAAQGSKDNTEPATAVHGDAELHCGSWSGNESNSIGLAHYYTETGGAGENAVSLPDGKYLLKAATYITRQPECVSLYASTDNKDMIMARFNGDKAAYDAAAGLNNGTTTELEITVSGGKLYIGVKGTAVVGGNGQSWQADNFRLYYIGGTPTDALTLNITDAGYATYYAPNAFEVPAGVTVGVVSAVADDKNSLTIDWRYPAGETVPGLTGVILKGDAGSYSAAASVANVIKPADNYLQGTLAETTVSEEGYTYYKLADGAQGLGFYYASEDGKSITNGANKAYLALPDEMAVSANFLLWDLDATGIGSTLADADAPVDVYTLSGVCVRSQVKMSQALQGLQKGIYIVNGKKLLIK